MKINAPRREPPSPIPVKVEHWWSKSARLWCVRMLNATDDQVGTSQYVPKARLAATIALFQAHVDKGEPYEE